MGRSRFFLNSLARHAVSFGCTIVLVIVLAGLAGADIPATLVVWIATSALVVGVWSRFESSLLRIVRVRCRKLDSFERESLGPALEGIGPELLIVDRAGPWLVRGLSTLVTGAGMLDLLDEREVRAMLFQATFVDPAVIAGSLVVWIGNLPLVVAWWFDRVIGKLGLVLAIVVGRALLFPTILGWDGFVTWTGRLFGALLTFMLGSLLATSGMAAAGVALMLAWATVPGMRALLEWESGRAERAADEAVVSAGFGWDLVGALEQLRLLDPEPIPPGVLGLLYRPTPQMRERVGRLWRRLARPQKT